MRRGGMGGELFAGTVKRDERMGGGDGKGVGRSSGEGIGGGGDCERRAKDMMMTGITF